MSEYPNYPTSRQCGTRFTDDDGRWICLRDKPCELHDTDDPQPPTPPAESHVDGSHGPGWDRDTVEDLIRRVKTAEPGDGWYEARDGDGALLDALLYDAESYQRSAGRHQRALAERDAARADLATARRDAAADALDWAAIQVADWHADPSRASQLMRYAAEVRAGTRTVPPADRSSDE